MRVLVWALSGLLASWAIACSSDGATGGTAGTGGSGGSETGVACGHHDHRLCSLSQDGPLQFVLYSAEPERARL
jgi:hypothetical protein